MKKTVKKVTMTTDEKVFNLCVESAKNSKNGYTFDLKDVWKAARLKYKLAKQTVIDAFEILVKEHEIKKVGEGPSNLFSLVELMPKEEKKAEPTPIMKQFRELKAKHPDALILFRCGDFYETYNEDAEKCGRILGITVRKYHETETNDIKVAGFPYHALDTYLPKLVRAGYRVAICDQLEDPKLTAKRGITEIVEPKKEPEKGVTNGEGERPRGYGRFLTDCEIANREAKKLAKKLFSDFVRFEFSRYDETNNVSYKNQSEAVRAKADMDNLKHSVKIVEGVYFTGETRLEAYEKFLNTVG